MGFKFPRSSETVESETTFGKSPSAGTKRSYSRGNHTHGTPSLPTLAVMFGFWTATQTGPETMLFYTLNNPTAYTDHLQALTPMPLAGNFTKVTVNVISNTVVDGVVTLLVWAGDGVIMVEVPYGGTGVFEATGLVPVNVNDLVLFMVNVPTFGSITFSPAILFQM